METRKKLKIWHKILIGIGGVLVFAIAFILATSVQGFLMTPENPKEQSNIDKSAETGEARLYATNITMQGMKCDLEMESEGNAFSIELSGQDENPCEGISVGSDITEWLVATVPE